jgi:hypothetical protein
MVPWVSLVKAITYVCMPSVSLQHCSVIIHYFRLHFHERRLKPPEAYMAILGDTNPSFTVGRWRTLLLVLTSKIYILISCPFRTHDHIFVLSKILLVLKRGLFFAKGRGMTTSVHSPSTEGDSNGHLLTNRPFDCLGKLLLGPRQHNHSS